MLSIVKFDTEEKYIKDFTVLKKKLYTRKNNTESVSDIERILTGTHPLMTRLYTSASMNA